MSPEQAQGKTKEIDQRSDIFSFGCILFEAATGKKPFEGESIIKSLHMVVYEPAPLLADLNPAAPAELQRIVRRCLAKDPDERYQSIKEVAIELKELRREIASGGIETTVPPPPRNSTAEVPGAGATRSQSVEPIVSSPSPSLQTRASSAEYVVTGIKQHKIVAVILVLVLVAGAIGLGLLWRARNSEPGTAINSIAVMPFVNESGNADVEYLSDGLTETLISSLSQLPNLNVKPRSSVFRYKGKATDSKTIGKELNVQAILNGRVAQLGEELSLFVELIDIALDKVVWSQQYNRKPSDLVTPQSEIARDVSSKLKTKLSGADEAKVTKTYTANSEAYQLYMQGRYHLAKRTKDGMQRSIRYFQEAIKLDPNFAMAYVGIAESYNSMPAYPYMSIKEAIPQAKAAAQRALEIEPDLAEAHTALATSIALYDWNWAESEREFKRAFELSPNSAVIHYRYAMNYLSPMGRTNEAINEINHALELEPLALNMRSTLSQGYGYARQNEKALEVAKKLYETEPNFVGGRIARKGLCKTWAAARG